MTVARVSQAVLETLRTNNAAAAQVSQAAFEVMRTGGINAQISQAALEVLRDNGAPISGQATFMFIIAT